MLLVRDLAYTLGPNAIGGVRGSANLGLIPLQPAYLTQQPDRCDHKIPLSGHTLTFDDRFVNEVTIHRILMAQVGPFDFSSQS